MSTSLKPQLIEWIRKLSYRTGDFTLASGKKSTFYIDLKNTTLHPRGASLIGEMVVECVQNAGLSIQGVGGLTLGADPIATAVSIKALERGIEWPAFIVRKEVKAHGTSKPIEGAENLPKGARVLVLEDVVTTGGSSQIAIDRLREAGFAPVAVLTVVDRESGGREKLESQGLKFLSLIKLTEIYCEGDKKQ